MSPRRTPPPQWSTLACVALAACGAAHHTPEPHASRTAPPSTHAPGAPGASGAPTAPHPAADGDGDRVRNECDQCPREPETYNGILDADGCPDSSGESHAVMADPTVRFGSAIRLIEFAEGDSHPPPDAAEIIRTGALPGGMLDLDGAERIVCVGQADATEPDAHRLAAERAAALCRLAHRLHLAPGATWSERSVAAHEITDESHPAFPPHPSASLVVTRAAGVDVWRWTGSLYTRATPRRRLRYEPPLPPGCVPASDVSADGP